MLKKIVAAVSAAAVAGVATASVAAAVISGAGATFPAPVYAKWAEAYRAQSGVSLNYQAIGSGGGVRQISARTVAFGASDKPLKPDDLAANGLIQFPTVIGGVVPVVNIPGVQPAQLKLTGPLLSDIFRGVIKRWDDKLIAAQNPGLKLPAMPITVVHRSDGSGTTFLFTSYLTMKAANWANQVGANDSVSWPTGIGGKGNDGVAAFVKQTPGSIGYVEYAFARRNRMTHTLLLNKAGKWAVPSAGAFSAAAAGAKWQSAPGYYLLLLDQADPNAWPITGATFILVHKKQSDAATGREVLKFFDWAYRNGDGAAAQLDYVPMPASVKAMVRKTWLQVKGPDGQPVYAAQ
jgi:phosphate transport system substrate-binding protein